jgi:hypothetical protein
MRLASSRLFFAGLATCALAGCQTSSSSGDAGTADAALVDAGRMGDAGPPGPDAGMADGGLPDAGLADAGLGAFTSLLQGAPLPPPDVVITPGNGLSSSFIDAQHDAAGNMWAVSSSHLFLRRNGFQAWESFNSSNGLSSQEILSVGGGVANTAWVGYRGLGDGDDTDPPSWWYTGGTDKVVLTSTGISVTHYALVSPPGTYSQYPDGRFKLRRTLRVYPTKTGPFAGDAWFGANHGGAQVNAAGVVLEHHHPLLCVWDPSINDCSTTHEGDVPAIGFYPNGNVLFGGTYGIGSLDYNDGEAGGDFWGDEPIHNMTLFTNVNDPSMDSAEDIVGVAAASDNTVWAASAHSGIAHLHLDSKTIDIFQVAQGLPTNDLEDIALDSHDQLWIATTSNGLYRLDLRTGVVSAATGLPSQNMHRIMFEKMTLSSCVTAIVDGGIVIYNVK